MVEEEILNKKPVEQFRVLERHIVLFDGVCNLCNNAVDFIIRHDKEGRFAFASLQSEIGRDLLRHHGLSTTDLDSMVLVKGGKTYQKSSAALEIAADLGGGLKYLKALKVVPGLLRDAAYNFVARNRYQLYGKQESCRLPTAEERERFLS